MRRFTKIIIPLLLVLFGLVYYLADGLDEIEGRGYERKQLVKWAFKNTSNLDQVEDYLLLQRFDRVRQKPRLNVQGKYWLKGGQYLELNNISQDDFLGNECLGFRLEDYFLKCSIDNEPPAHVCQSSFLANAKILPANATIHDVAKAYNEIKYFYENYPKRRSEGIKYLGTDIPQPLQKYRQIFSETQINCWVERSGISIERPVSFLCDKEYHKCKSSPSIKLLYEK